VAKTPLAAAFVSKLNDAEGEAGETQTMSSFPSICTEDVWQPLAPDGRVAQDRQRAVAAQQSQAASLAIGQLAFRLSYRTHPLH